MKTKRLIALLIAASPFPLVAQGPPQGPRPDPIATTLDRDHDGEISREELEAAPESLAKLDRDENGELFANESGLKHPGGPNGPGGGPNGQGQGPGRGPGGPPPHGGQR